MKAKDCYFKVPIPEDQTAKRVTKARWKLLESRRQLKKFKLYKEDEVFGDSMLYLEALFRQTQPEKTRCQDEDVNSDEELVQKNKRDNLLDLKETILKFLALKNLKTKRDMVRNYRNTKIMTGALGEQVWN